MSFNNPTTNFTQSNNMREHMQYCERLNNTGISLLNNAQNQSQLNQAISTTIEAAEKDLNRPMTYAEMRERFG